MTGSVAVTVWAAHLREFRAHLELGLERQADHLTAWQLRVFDRLSAEYQSLAARHHEERSLRSVGSSGAIDGSSPMRNAEVVREELKRATIQLLSGGSYPPAAARTGVEDAHTGPAFDPDLATSSGPVVQFLEQAFEWENLTYVLYPYYWTDPRLWAELADLEGADPDFDRFLRSGSARVVVPARHPLEDQVRAFVDFGVLWGGGPVPAIGDPEYVSVAEEIKAMHLAPADGEPGEWWDVTLPTTMVALDHAAHFPLTNPMPALGPSVLPGGPTP